MGFGFVCLWGVGGFFVVFFFKNRLPVKALFLLFQWRWTWGRSWGQSDTREGRKTPETILPGVHKDKT